MTILLRLPAFYPVLHGTNFKTFSRLNFVASFVASFVETTTKEPAFAASGLLSTKLATKKRDGKHV
jgi:hypothetical protein